MLVNNGGGLPQGDTDNPELIAQPRGGTPAVIDTREGLEKAARALAQGSTPIALDVERAQGFRYVRTRIWFRSAARMLARS